LAALGFVNVCFNNDAKPLKFSTGGESDKSGELVITILDFRMAISDLKSKICNLKSQILLHVGYIFLASTIQSHGFGSVNHFGGFRNSVSHSYSIF
jgi:hypothetical protein